MAPPPATAQYPVQFDSAKPSYDDLIDQYASPYAVSTKHKSFAFEHSSKQSLSTEETGKVMESSGDYRISAAYPPPASRLPPPDTRSFWQKILPESLACRLYILTVLVETTIDLAIEADLLLRVHQAGEQADASDNTAMIEQKMPVYLCLFAFAHIFQLGMAVEAVYARNTLQFISLAMFNVLLLLYAIIQSSEVHAAVSSETGIIGIPINVLLVLVPCAISVCELSYIALGWKIYKEFGWKVYKFLGADRRIKQMYTSYQIFQCLVKFDIFFWAGYCVQLIWLVLQKSDWSFYVTCALLPLSVLLLIEGHLAARYENKWMMITFLSGCVGALVYFAYQLVKTLVNKDTQYYVDVWQSLAVFSVFALLLLVATITYTCIVFRNFGKGLKEQVARKQAQPSTLGTNKHSVYPTMAGNPNRMSID